MPAERIRKLALAYVEFSAANRGVGPGDKQALKKFLLKEHGLSEQEAEELFVSPRDNQPYTIRWKLALAGSGPIGPKPPKPKLIIYETNGLDGARYVADDRISIVQMTQEEFAAAVPSS
jgi:hypothetical protein